MLSIPTASYTLAGMAKKKNPAAVSLGRKGGKARWQGVSPAERSEAAKKAITARWAKRKRPTH